jgi:hypothetical protein
VIEDFQLYFVAFTGEFMESEERKSSGSAKDPAAIEKLRQLTRKLCSNDITTARLAAFNLSWMQEDGMAILTKILLGDFSRTTKKAAAYGLRSMKGRMKKPATEVLEQGCKNRDRTTRAACIKALAIMKGEAPPKNNAGKNRRKHRIPIKEIKDSSTRDTTKTRTNRNSKYRGR